MHSRLLGNSATELGLVAQAKYANMVNRIEAMGRFWVEGLPTFQKPRAGGLRKQRVTSGCGEKGQEPCELAMHLWWVL